MITYMVCERGEFIEIEGTAELPEEQGELANGGQGFSS